MNPRVRVLVLVEKEGVDLLVGEKMYKSIVYEGDDVVGEVEIYPQNQGLELMKEIRISHYSQPSERCPPLAVLHTITSCGVCFKMESSKAQSQDTPLYLLHSTCIRENKVYNYELKTHKNQAPNSRTRKPSFIKKSDSGQKDPEKKKITVPFMYIILILNF